jgi:hypothetical protein
VLCSFQQLRHPKGELAVRRWGYWAALLGEPETKYTRGVTIRLPSANSLNVTGLLGLMGRAARKEPL